jgi:AcrR family transcriptional regulator
MPRRQVRPARQQRSQDSWRRILDAGVEILIKQGRGELTVVETCRRAGVNPPSLYARVDGIAGLFWAIYDREMAHVAHTYDELLIGAARTDAGSPARIQAVVKAICETFRRHEVFLHQIINISVSDVALRERGSRESLALVDRIALLLPKRPAGAARDVARMLHQECVFRAMYGNHWLSHQPESFAIFGSRLASMAKARFTAPVRRS